MKKAIGFLSVLLLAGLALAASMELTSARLYKKQGEWLKSAQFYSEALQKDPSQLEAYFERGELYMAIAADPSKADIAKQLAPEAADPKVELYKLALADFKEARTPRNSKDEGTVKKLSKKIDEQLQRQWVGFYATALGHDTVATDYKNRGQADSARLIYGEALRALDMATLLMPARWNPYGFKAQIYGKLDSTEQSATYWQQTIEKITAQQQNPDNSAELKGELADGLTIARENLLVDCYNLERRDCVMEQADALLAADPTNINAVTLKANTLAYLATDTTKTVEERNRLKQEAIAALGKALESQEGEGGDQGVKADILYTIGQFHLQLGDTAKAIEAMSKALEARPDDVDALFLTGVLYLEGGSFTNTEKARDTFKKLTEVNPDNAAAWTNYGVALIRLGQTEEGRKMVEKAKTLNK